MSNGRLRDPQVLMKQMKLREALEEIDTPEAVPRTWTCSVQSEIKQLTDALRAEIIDRHRQRHCRPDTIRKLKLCTSYGDELERIEDSLIGDSW